MAIKILIRFDDICPTMDWEQWEKAKKLLDEKGKVALLGVVPDCQDPDLDINKPLPDFWDYVRNLQKQGFTIAMHGYRHVFECDHSEFAGLSYEKQLYKIKEGKRILNEHGIETDVFFAPAHNFDDNTLKALSACGFKFVSDGLSQKPYKRYGVTLLPCRCGGIPRIKRNSGHITAVIHAHEWTTPQKSSEWYNFEQLINKHSDKIVPFAEFLKWPLGNSLIQRIDELCYSFYVHRLRSILINIRKFS